MGRITVTPPPGAGGGGSVPPGVPVVRAFPFAFDAPGLAAGHTLYTPSTGDLLLDAYLIVDTPWDGTTPLGDFGTFRIGGNDVGTGILAALTAVAAWDMTFGVASLGEGWRLGQVGQRLGQTLGAGMVPGAVQVAPSPPYSEGALKMVDGNYTVFLGLDVPIQFTDTLPIKVAVSQDGSAGGADPGATVGAATLYLVTCTPATA